MERTSAQAKLPCSYRVYWSETYLLSKQLVQLSLAVLQTASVGAIHHPNQSIGLPASGTQQVSYYAEGVHRIYRGGNDWVSKAVVEAATKFGAISEGGALYMSATTRPCVITTAGGALLSQQSVIAEPTNT